MDLSFPLTSLCDFLPGTPHGFTSMAADTNMSRSLGAGIAAAATHQMPDRLIE
jgi:hypothetical protein